MQCNTFGAFQFSAFVPSNCNINMRYGCVIFAILFVWARRKCTRCCGSRSAEPLFKFHIFTIAIMIHNQFQLFRRFSMRISYNVDSILVYDTYYIIIHVKYIIQFRLFVFVWPCLSFFFCSQRWNRNKMSIFTAQIKSQCWIFYR